MASQYPGTALSHTVPVIRVKPTTFLFAVGICTGTLGVWGFGLGLFTDAPVSLVAVGVAGLLPLASAGYEAFVRDSSEFVFFHGDGWFILTGLTAIAVAILFPTVAVMVPGGFVLVGLLVVPAVAYYAYYLGYRLRNRGDEASE